MAHIITAGYIYTLMLLEENDILEHWTTPMIRAVSLLLLWFSFFDWLRLFDITSFLVKLVMRTLYDTIPFMILLIVALAMIGSAMYSLQLNVDQEANSNDVVEPVFNFFIFDMLYNQYMLSLGEFAMDGFEDHPNERLAYVLFLFSTFFTQITFLNMLIAIMGNTFDSVMEKKSQNGYMQKLKFMSQYHAIYNSKSGREQDLKSYLLVVTPTQSEEQKAESSATEEWEGSLNSLKKSLQIRLKEMQKRLLSQNARNQDS